MALIIRAAAVVTKSASPSASMVNPMAAMTITSAGESPAIAPRKPPARAKTRHAAKFPNRISPMPWEE